jgi:hypothetical protein
MAAFSYAQLLTAGGHGALDALPPFPPNLESCILLGPSHRQVSRNQRSSLHGQVLLTRRAWCSPLCSHLSAVAFQYALNKAASVAQQAHPHAQGTAVAQPGAVQQHPGSTTGEVLYLCQRSALEQSHVVLAPGCSPDHPGLQRVSIRCVVCCIGCLWPNCGVVSFQCETDMTVPATEHSSLGVPLGCVRVAQVLVYICDIAIGCEAQYTRRALLQLVWV